MRSLRQNQLSRLPLPASGKHTANGLSLLSKAVSLSLQSKALDTQEGQIASLIPLPPRGTHTHRRPASTAGQAYSSALGHCLVPAWWNPHSLQLWRERAPQHAPVVSPERGEREEGREISRAKHLEPVPAQGLGTRPRCPFTLPIPSPVALAVILCREGVKRSRQVVCFLGALGGPSNFRLNPNSAPSFPPLPFSDSPEASQTLVGFTNDSTAILLPSPRLTMSQVGKSRHTSPR